MAMDTDSLTIKELQERYGIKTRQTVYNWCEAAGIEFDKDDRNRSIIPADKLPLLDQVRDHVADGGRLDRFTPISATVPDTVKDSALDTTEDSSTPTVYPPEDTHLLVQLLGAIASHLPASSPLDAYRDLEEAAAKGWLLDSSTVRSLIGVAPRGERFVRGCWQFDRAGKLGRSSAWRVTKAEYP